MPYHLCRTIQSHRRRDIRVAGVLIESAATGGIHVDACDAFGQGLLSTLAVDGVREETPPPILADYIEDHPGRVRGSGHWTDEDRRLFFAALRTAGTA